MFWIKLYYNFLLFLEISIYLKVYTKQVLPMLTAKIFQNGQSQAVRLPKEFRFSGDEVFIKKQGNAVILLPKDNAWASLFKSLDEFSDDFMSERNQPHQQIREDL